MVNLVVFLETILLNLHVDIYAFSVYLNKFSQVKMSQYL